MIYIHLNIQSYDTYSPMAFKREDGRDVKIYTLGEYWRKMCPKLTPLP